MTRISLHQALLEMHAPTTVTTAYKTFVNAATTEAGPQMTAAWNLPAATEDTHVPLGRPYERTRSNYARTALVRAMKADLGRLD